MQGLFIHTMITDDARRRGVVRDLNDRIEAYNRQRYVSRLRAGSDNLVYYGQYTEQLARLIGIAPRLADCRSLEDLSIHYFFPNAACKYRQRGRYAIEGTTELVRAIHREHRGYALLKLQLVQYALLLTTALATLLLLYRTQWVPKPPSVLLGLVLLVALSPVIGLVNTNSHRITGPTSVMLLAGLGLTARVPHPLVPLGSLGLTLAVIYACRRLRWSRVLFNDMHYKDQPRYRAFFERYRGAFLDVAARRRSARGDA